jgi:prepilin-type N-terminal cleavage/methylation domain-containing protein
MIAINQKNGFTLVETIVAVTILVTAITGPMVLAASSLRATRDARNELIATHLAEESIEVLHNIRDNNITNYPSGSWLTSILPGCDGAGCVIDVTAQDLNLVWSLSAVIPCAPDCTSISPVYYNPNSGLYRQSSSALTSPWVLTPFKRTVRVVGVDDPVTPLRQVRIFSTVTFLGFGGKERSITVDDDLYNWFPPLR